MLYFDYAASTPVAPEIQEIYLKACESFANPSSPHPLGWEAQKWVESSNQTIRNVLGLESNWWLTFTSGATESHFALFYGLRERIQKGEWSFTPHVLISNMEHPSVRENALYLQSLGLINVDFVEPPTPWSPIGWREVSQAIRKETVLVSIMWVHNETGLIHDIPGISQGLASTGIAFHTDATQALGKFFIDLNTLKVDFFSFSGHKIYAPKGIGALAYRGHKWGQPTPWILGGGHQKGLRSGTLPVPLIAALGEAVRRANDRDTLEKEWCRIQEIKKLILDELMRLFPGLIPLGEFQNTVPHILGTQWPGYLLPPFFLNFCVSYGSACRSEKIGNNQKDDPFVRISLGHPTTATDVEKLLQEWQILKIKGLIRPSP